MLPSNHVIGKIRLHFRSIDSTNDYAMHLVSKINPSDGLVVTTDFQSSGKGQFGRKWHGMPGQNIALTVILLPRILKADMQFYISKAISIAVAEAIQSFTNKPVLIKWPNDLIIQDRKISGILIQNVLVGKLIKSATIGIGLNVLQKEFDGEFKRRPTSLISESGDESDIHIRKVEKTLMKAIGKWYNKLLAQDFTAIDAAYHQKLEHYNETISYTLGTSVEYKKGILHEVDANGKIGLLEEGVLKSYALGDISIVG